MKRSSSGFTLIEVMISAAILAVLSTLVARSIQQSVRAKVKIQSQIDDVSQMRDALRLIQRDINLAFHFRDIQKELDDLVRQLNQPTPPAGATPEQLQAIQAAAESRQTPREVPRQNLQTHFHGADSEMHFVTMNNARVFKDSRQADFMEVGYFLKDCRSLDGKRSSKCLWRRTSSAVDQDVTKGGEEIVLIEDLSEFSLMYIGRGKQDWVKDWKTSQGGDAATTGRFPQAVQVSMTVEKGEGDTKKKYSMQIVAAIHFPNNKEDDRGNRP